MIVAPNSRAERLAWGTTLQDPKPLASDHAFWGTAHAV